MKKLMSLVLVGVLAFSTVACSENAQSDLEQNSESMSELQVSMVTDVGGVNDQSFNQSAWEGLQRANAEFGTSVNYMESKQESDYETNIQFLVDEESDVILGIGFLMADAVLDASKNYPDNKFAIVDNSYGEDTPENVIGITFKEHEVSYLAGYVAGKTTKTNKVGFVGGIDFYLINKFQYGFMAGVKRANPEAEVFVQYAGSFGDAAAGKSIAEQFYNSGADVIYHASGATGNGVIEAAKEKNKWVIGVDRDQSDLAPENVLTSAMKRVDNAVYNLTKEIEAGNWAGGSTVEFGLAEGGVDLAPTTDRHVPAEIMDEVEEIKNQIITGNIFVPENKEQYESSM